MSPKILLFALAGSLALAACDTMPPHRWSHGKKPHIPPSKQCLATPTCEIDIDYEDASSGCGSYCYPIAPAYVNVMPDPTQKPKSIPMVWKLPIDSLAKFADKVGVEFDSKDSGFGPCFLGTFANRKDDRSFTCVNDLKHTDPEIKGWKYTIRLVLPPGDRPLLPLDPSVVNH
jgi:hypothetical protein